MRTEILAIISFVFAIAFAMYGLYQLSAQIIDYGSVFLTIFLAITFMVYGFMWNPTIFIKKK